MEKNKLVIDEESAAVVRRIFDLACDGKTTTQIATVLTSEDVDAPLMYRKRKGRLLVDVIKLVLFLAVKTEVDKMLNFRQKLRNAARKSSTDQDAALLEMKRLTARTARLERDAYLVAKSECAAEVAHAENRLVELNAVLAVQATDSNILHDEPILQRALHAEDVTGEVLALMDRIVMHDPERIEIRFAFDDTNM